MLLIKNALIINEGRSFQGSVVVEDEKISAVYDGVFTGDESEFHEIVNAEGLWLLPGVIDAHVHFREPGLTHKADVLSESAAAAAGGVTSVMEMPNTMPLTITKQILDEKYLIGAEKSVVNYSFYMGATNDNLQEILKVNPSEVCGVKVFMGSSTGNMLVDNTEILSRIFAEVPMIITTHCEDEGTIQKNKAHFKAMYGDDLPMKFHPLIRDVEACYRSSAFAVELAAKYGARLHVLHLSTAREMSLFSNTIALKDKKITAEVCLHHLWFSDEDYEHLGTLIKWNPAIKTSNDRDALIHALRNDIIDVVATDHAPHLLREKEGNCFKAASGGPLVQFSLQGMLQMVNQGKFSKEFVVRKMCHAPAELYRVRNRGFIRSGYFADLVLVNPMQRQLVQQSDILSKCGWSPFEGIQFDHSIHCTWVNGNCVYKEGRVNMQNRGKRLNFN